MLTPAGLEKGDFVGGEMMSDAVNFDVCLTLMNGDELHVALGPRTMNAARRINHFAEMSPRGQDAHCRHVFDHPRDRR